MDLKEYIKSLVNQMIDEESSSADAGAYLTPKAFSPKGQKKNLATKQAIKSGWKLAKKPTTSKVVDYKKIFEQTPMKESLLDIIEKELLNEVTYGKFKKDVKFRTKSEQLHKAIREVKRKLAEVDRIVEYTSRMKQELSENESGLNYWKATQKNVAAISEMVNQLNNKIKNLNQ
jgi:predicted transcriptional regulator